jgi:hypothetical protein
MDDMSGPSGSLDSEIQILFRLLRQYYSLVRIYRYLTPGCLFIFSRGVRITAAIDMVIITASIKAFSAMRADGLGLTTI